MALKLLKEFKEFAVKGNMIDIAIGVIIGAAFNKVVDIIVKDVLSPPLAMLTGGIHFANQKIVLKKEILEQGVVVQEEIAIAYGKLIEASIDFFIIGLTIFLVVKFMNSLRKKADDPQNVTEVTHKDIELLHKLTELIEKQNEILEQSTARPST